MKLQYTQLAATGAVEMQYNIAKQTRRGATLVEILMSLMVMSIGLVSVAALFPISMLRSAQSTQLTNAAMLGYQCEDYIQAMPGLIRNHYDSTLGTVIPNREYRANSVAAWRYGLDASNYANRLPINVVTVIDPIGAYMLQQSGAGAGQIDFYGFDENLHTINSNMYRAERLNAGFNLPNQKDMAFDIFASNDSWSTTLTSAEISIDSTRTILELRDVAAGDLQMFSQALTDGAKGRVVVFSQSGKQSYITRLQSISGQYLTISPALPNNNLYNAIPEVRLELYEPRYTSMITVRRRLSRLRSDMNTPPININEVALPGPDGAPQTQVANLVVFYRRDFSRHAEQVYEADSIPGQPQQAIVRWSSSHPDLAPKLRSGGWIFDSYNGYWYRITSVVTEERNSLNPKNATNNREAVLELDRAIEPGTRLRYVTAPQHVVEVFNFSL